MTGCEKEFRSLREALEHENDPNAVHGPATDIPQIKAQPKEQKKKEPVVVKNKPIQLKYIYEGSCESCGSEVDTLEITISGIYAVVAYCVTCKKKLLDSVVTPIEEQLKKKK